MADPTPADVVAAIESALAIAQRVAGVPSTADELATLRGANAKLSDKIARMLAKIDAADAADIAEDQARQDIRNIAQE